MVSSKDHWDCSNLEDEPCDSCGIKPSRHYGHGSFICKVCYDKWWCPKCTFRLEPDHICKTEEERITIEKEFEKWFNSDDNI